jgi:hypothetical protein
VPQLIEAGTIGQPGILISFAFRGERFLRVHLVSLQSVLGDGLATKTAGPVVFQGAYCSKSNYYATRVAVANPYISVWSALSSCLFTSLPRRVARPFMCCHDSHSTNAILSTCLAMFCTSVIFTATAFPNHSPRHFLCTSHISSLAFLSHLPLYPQIPICCTDCARFGRFVDTESECLSLLCLPFWRYT